MKIFILVLFILTYVLIIALPKYKVYFTGAAAVIAAGADVLVAGSSVFHAADVKEAILALRACEKSARF